MKKEYKDDIEVWWLTDGTYKSFLKCQDKPTGSQKVFDKRNYNMYCEHPNECPNVCPCPPFCGCRIWGYCSDQQEEPEKETINRFTALMDE